MQQDTEGTNEYSEFLDSVNPDPDPVREDELTRERKHQEVIRMSDMLFAACLQYLVGREPEFLVPIRDLSQKLIDAGYEPTFEQRKRALTVRSMFTRFTQEYAFTSTERDKLNPRTDDTEALPDGE